MVLHCESLTRRVVGFFFFVLILSILNFFHSTFLFSFRHSCREILRYWLNWMAFRGNISPLEESVARRARAQRKTNNRSSANGREINGRIIAASIPNEWRVRRAPLAGKMPFPSLRPICNRFPIKRNGTHFHIHIENRRVIGLINLIASDKPLKWREPVQDFVFVNENYPIRHLSRTRWLKRSWRSQWRRILASRAADAAHL